jgi:hypothetical protein
MKGITITIMAFLFVLFLGVVYGAISATGNNSVDMSGKIIGICQNNLQGNNNVPDSILVQGTTSGSSEDQNISVEITKNTVVLYKQGNTLENASSNDLVPGQVIGIKFSGPLLQTYPPQTNASQIIILDNQG